MTNCDPRNTRRKPLEESIPTGRDNKLMLSELKSFAMAHPRSLGEMQDYGLIGSVNLLVFGFEAVNPDGHMVHPRSRARDVPLPPNADVISVGETWKVREFTEAQIDESAHMVGAIEKISAIVTDGGVHVRRGDAFDLSCCQTRWAAQAEASCVWTDPVRP